MTIARSFAPWDSCRRRAVAHALHPDDAGTARQWVEPMPEQLQRGRAPALLHNVGEKFPTAAIRSAYKALGASKDLRIEPKRLSDEEIAEWISRLE